MSGTWPCGPKKGETKLSADKSLTMDAAFRYANALFGLAKETNSIEKYEKELDKLLEPVKADGDLSAFIQSPIYPRDVQEKVMKAICSKLGLSKDVANTVLLMASKRRIFALAEMILHFKRLCRNFRNEIVVEVVSAVTLSDSFKQKIKKTVSSNVDREVMIEADCDPSLMGGLVIKIGSKMIDASLRTKFVKLKYKLKEVG